MSIWEALSPYELTALIAVGVALSAPVHVVGMAHVAFKSVKAKAEKHGSYLIVFLTAVFIIGVYSSTAGVPTDSQKLANFGSFFGGVSTGIGVLFAGISLYQKQKEQQARDKEKAQDDLFKMFKHESETLLNKVIEISSELNKKSKVIANSKSSSQIISTALEIRSLLSSCNLAILNAINLEPVNLTSRYQISVTKTIENRLFEELSIFPHQTYYTKRLATARLMEAKNEENEDIVIHLIEKITEANLKTTINLETITKSLSEY